RIADPRPLDLDARLDDVADGPDAHRLAGTRDLELGAHDPRILPDGGQRRLTVDLEPAALVPRARAELDSGDRKRPELKTHERPPAWVRARADRRASDA